MASPDTTAVPILETRGLRFAYGTQRILDGLDTEVRPGEVVGFLGPNGSGKSTLLKILSGVLAPYEGSARVVGGEVRETAPRELARSLAVVQQEPRFAFPFSVLEIVLLGRHPHLAGLAFENERDVEVAHEALERCGAAEMAGRPIHELSSGERQRVVFARALAQEPRALLLDEPASFLDIRYQVELYDVVRALAEERGTGVLTVMHDLNLAAEYCDRVYLLRAGRIEAGGPTDEVLTYANLKRTFNTEVYVDVNALTGKLVVLPLSRRARERIEN